MTYDPAYEPREGLTHRDADWSGLRVLVVGLGVSGFAAADALAERGAVVTAVSRDTTPAITERATILEILDVDVRIGPEHVVTPPEGTELVVTSPGVPPHDPLMLAAAAAGIPVWGEVELAWRMRAAEGSAPWLTVTGTNGKTTTVTMLASILQAGGLRATAAGNVGTPLLEAVLHPEPYDVLAVELSSFQLHWQRSVSAVASAVLNVAPDHLDWHGSYAEYLQAKGKIYDRTHLACIYNVDDLQTEQLVMDAEVVEGCRAVGFTIGHPGALDARRRRGRPRRPCLRRAAPALRRRAVHARGPPGRRQLRRAALRGQRPRRRGARPRLRRRAARGARRPAVLPPRPAPDRRGGLLRRGALGQRLEGDQPARRGRRLCAPSRASCGSPGGCSRAPTSTTSSRTWRGRLRGVVLIGADRAEIAQALARHAPEIPVVDLAETDTGVMDLVVAAAARLAQPGDVVLLAPAAASMDMFTDYGARGDAFEEAVRRHVEASGGDV